MRCLPGARGIDDVITRFPSRIRYSSYEPLKSAFVYFLQHGNDPQAFMRLMNALYHYSVEFAGKKGRQALIIDASTHEREEPPSSPKKKRRRS